MNYELAKQLEVAGYENPFLSQERLKRFPNKPFLSPGQDFVYEPKLSELIKACGEDFGNLALKDYRPEAHSQWIAEPAYKISMDFDVGAGFTPEDAVARLWLHLNKK
jgi:hypothetical protein